MVAFMGLQLLFLSDSQLVAGGYDCMPLLFQEDANGDWWVSCARSLPRFSLPVLLKLQAADRVWGS